MLNLPPPPAGERKFPTMRNKVSPGRMPAPASIHVSKPLPAQPHYPAAQRLAPRNIDQIEDDLIFARMARNRLEDFRIAQAYNENLRFGDHALDVFTHERPDMRDMLLDEPPVRPEQPRQVHLRVVHEQTQPFADELLRDQDERALAQIVGSGLERQPDHPHAAASRSEN